jgi:hypothetical protein
MLGLALGAFTQGFANGVNMGLQLKEISKQNRLKQSLQGITESGKTQFEADVAAGKQDPNDFDAYYANHIVPQYANQLLMEGEPDKASAWTDWATSTAAKKATKQFGIGLQQFQAGDINGAIASMQRAADTNGYGPDGKMSIAEIYDEDAGGVTGYRVGYTLADGTTHSKNVATADLPSFFAATINPQSAFELQQAQAAEEAKATREVSTYKRKKQADVELGTTPGAMTQAQYQNAIQEERKAIEANSLTDPELKDLTGAEKEAMAKANVDQRLGRATGVSEPQVTVDPTTGEQVQMPSLTPAQDSGVTPQQIQAPPAPVPADNVPADPDMQPLTPATDSGVETPTSSTAPGITAPSPAAATSQVGQTDKQGQVARADQLVKQGADAQQIAQALMAAAVPVSQWPQAVKLAVSGNQLGIGG